MSKVKAIIFDLDGVIVSTDVCHYRAWKKIAEKIGIYFDEKINDHLRGVSRMDSLEIILSIAEVKLSPEEKNLLAEEKNRYYREYLNDLMPNQVSAENLCALKTLKANGIKLAIGSSSKNARTILEKLNLMDLFDAISDGNNISQSKPDPEVFIKAAEYLMVSPSECIVVEDAKSGILAGKNAGMITVAYGAAAGKYAADYFIATISGIRSVLSELSI